MKLECLWGRESDLWEYSRLTVEQVLEILKGLGFRDITEDRIKNILDGNRRKKLLSDSNLWLLGKQWFKLNVIERHWYYYLQVKWRNGILKINQQENICQQVLSVDSEVITTCRHTTYCTEYVDEENPKNIICESTLKPEIICKVSTKILKQWYEWILVRDWDFWKLFKNSWFIAKFDLEGNRIAGFKLKNKKDSPI